MKTAISLALLITTHTASANTVELITKGNTQVVERVETRTIEKQPVIERRTETKYENTTYKNRLRLLVGAFEDSFSEYYLDEENNTRKKTKLPDEKELLYGVGYDRLMGGISIGVSFQRNQSQTVKIWGASIGFNW